MKDTSDSTNASLTQRCVALGDAVYVGPQNTNGSIYTKVDVDGYSTAATHYCSEVSGLCRTNLHVVYSAATAQVMNTMLTGGEYSLDGGATWTSQGSSSFYEQHTDATDGTYYQVCVLMMIYL